MLSQLVAVLSVMGTPGPLQRPSTALSMATSAAVMQLGPGDELSHQQVVAVVEALSNLPTRECTSLFSHSSLTLFLLFHLHV